MTSSSNQNLSTLSQNKREHQQQVQPNWPTSQLPVPMLTPTSHFYHETDNEFVHRIQPSFVSSAYTSSSRMIFRLLTNS